MLSPSKNRSLLLTARTVYISRKPKLPSGALHLASSVLRHQNTFVQKRTMASATKIVISPDIKATFRADNLSPEAARVASEVLQQNHEDHDIFFHPDGLHNHTVHHILTAFALGADADTIKEMYEIDLAMQRPQRTFDDKIFEDLKTHEGFMKHLDQRVNYPMYLAHFREALEKSSYQDVVNEYLFKNDKRATRMLHTLFAGFYHPLIHLGFGIEFEQPAIIAEALAQTAVTGNRLEEFFTATDKTAKEQRFPAKTMPELIDAIRADEKLSTAAHWEDPNKVYDGILVRAKQEMINYASQWRPTVSNLKEATAQMINACAYFTGGAQHPPKQIKFDFYYMHTVTSSLFFTTFLRLPWIDNAAKLNLLERKGRLDLALYASRRSPEPLMEEITAYKPREPTKSDWTNVLDRARKHPDDGHASKFVRSFAHGEAVCGELGDRPEFRITKDMWLQLANMAIDSVEDSGERWVRSAGFDQAWEKYHDRPSAHL